MVRPIRPDDRDALHEAFLSLSEETRFRRFLRPVKELTGSELDYLTDVDHHDHEAVVAVDEAGEIVGVARYIRLADRPNEGEVAVTVRDEWQGRGVGTLVLRALIERARTEGVVAFTALCLASNRDMMILFDELGDGVRRTGAAQGAVELEIALPTDSHDRVRPALRAAARAPDLTAREPIAPAGD
jgi:GNAT superfamily N-acetyltransferase